MKKKLIQTIILLAVLAFLLIPSINPFLNEAGKAAVTAQIQDTFGGLLGGTGMLTPARLICAVAVVLVVWLVCSLLIVVLSHFGEKKRSTRSMVTVVPLPGAERIFRLSVKLSMMVKPMPERSSFPVV